MLKEICTAVADLNAGLEYRNRAALVPFLPESSRVPCCSQWISPGRTQHCSGGGCRRFRPLDCRRQVDDVCLRREGWLHGWTARRISFRARFVWRTRTTMIEQLIRESTASRTQWRSRGGVGHCAHSPPPPRLVVVVFSLAFSLHLDRDHPSVTGGSRTLQNKSYDFRPS